MRKLGAILLLSVIAALTGCGGSQSGGGSGTGSGSIVVQIAPTKATLHPNDTQQFTATVTGTSNTGVTWEVNNVVGGNSTLGTITSTGLYTAPANVPNPNTVTVTAVSQADPTKSGSALVTIVSSTTVAVNVSPSSAIVLVGAVQQFTATVTGTSNTAVMWEVDGVVGGNSTVGTISSSGLYKAPSIPPTTNPVTVIAVSQADPTKSSSAIVTIIGFSNGNVNGRYAFEFTGQIPSGPLFLAGSLKADGNGNVTDGTEDRIDVNGVSSLPITGSYSVGLDGRGKLTLTSSNGTMVDYRFVMDGAGRAALIGFDSSVVGSGVMAKQDTSAFSLSAIASNWAFGVSGTVVSGGLSFAEAVEAGRFTLDASRNVTLGVEDLNTGNPTTSMSNNPFTGSVGSPDPTTGRATASFTTAQGTLQYAFYIVSSSELFMITISPVSPIQASAFVGRAAQQSSISFTNGSFKGSYAFEWSGQGSLATSVVAEVGQMTADGNGGVSNGTYDLNDLVGPQLQQPFTGTYSLDPSGNGRGTMTVTGNQPSAKYVFYMASPASAFFVSADSGSVLAGVALAQSSGTFSNSSFAGSYGYTVNGFVTGAPTDTSGQLLPDGNGNISGAADTNFAGILIPDQTILLGSYNMSAVNGRFTLVLLLSGSPQPPPSTYVMYLVDSGHGFLVQVDPSQYIMAGTAAVEF